MHNNAVQKRFRKNIKHWTPKKTETLKKWLQKGVRIFNFWYLFGVFFVAWLQDGPHGPRMVEN
jgi:hypothetical protein